MRTLLAEAGTLELGEEGLSLRVAKPVLVVDPRGEESLEERMLRYLAGAIDRSAKQASETLGVPLRSAQRALKHLTDEGLLRADRVGAAVTYHLEDSAFSRPTRWS